MGESEVIIRVEHVSKVFGRRAEHALALRRAGKSKAELEQETGATIGVFDASFEVKRGAIFVVIGLSGGMLQRVGLARALASGQEILLMDEPFSALDPLIRRDMQNFLLDLEAQMNRTIVFVTHDIDEAFRLGHRVAIMKDGEIVQLGLPEEILTNPATEYVKRFVADVDSAKVRLAESVMVAPKDVAYESEGPRVVLRRMKNAGLSTIFVVDEERRLVGLADVDAIAALAELGAPELRAVVDTTAPRVQRQTCLRDILPFFVDRQIPVAVTDEAGELVGVITPGTPLAGFAASVRSGMESGALDVVLSVGPQR